MRLLVLSVLLFHKHSKHCCEAFKILGDELHGVLVALSDASGPDALVSSDLLQDLGRLLLNDLRRLLLNDLGRLLTSHPRMIECLTTHAQH